MPARQRYSFTMDDDQEFSFDYDPESEGPLTQTKVKNLYAKQREPRKNFLEKAFTSFRDIPDVNDPEFGSEWNYTTPSGRKINQVKPLEKGSYAARLANWVNTNINEPFYSPGGLVASVGSAVSLPVRAGVGMLGSAYAALNTPAAVKQAYEDPTMENVLNAVALPAGAAFGARDMFHTSGKISPTIQPKPFIGPEVRPPNYVANEPIGPIDARMGGLRGMSSPYPQAKKPLQLPQSSRPLMAAMEQGHLDPSMNLSSITNNPDMHMWGNQFPDAPLQLPASTQPRFFQGRQGVTDVTAPYINDPRIPPLSGTIQSHELGSVISNVSDPVLTRFYAEHGTGPAGLTPARASAGMGNRLAVGDPATRAFEALVPDRYKVNPPEPIKPTFSNRTEAVGLPGQGGERSVLGNEGYVSRLGRLGRDIPAGVIPDVVEPVRPSIERTRNVYPGEMSSASKARIRKEDGAKIPADIGGLARYKESIKATVKKDPTVSPVTKKAVESPVPEIAKAAATQVAKKSPWAKVKEGMQDPKRALTDIGEAISTTIDKDSEAGKNITRMLYRARTDSDRYAAAFNSRFDKIVEGLSKDEWTNLQESIEGKATPQSKKISDKLIEYSNLDADVIAKAKEHGVQMKMYSGKSVPIESLKDYWPHIFDDEFVNLKTEAGRAEFEAGLKAKGYSPDDITEMISNVKKFGGRFISSQHQRTANIEGYRTDPAAYRKHISDLMRRTGEAEHLGPKDLGDINSPLSQELAKTADEPRIREYLNQVLGRTEEGTGNKAWENVVSKVNTFNAATDLSMYALSQQSNKAMIPLRTNIKSFLKAIGEYKTQAGKETAVKSGAIQEATSAISGEAGGEGLMSKIYRTTATEKANRGLAANAGTIYFDELLARAKGNGKKLSKVEVSRLEDMALDDFEVVKKATGDDLTKFRERAGGRMSELTQGISGKFDLPPMWTDSPHAKLITMYKKFGFLQAKAIKNYILENPKVNIPIAFGMMQLFGEPIADVKEGMKAGLKGENPLDAVANRGGDGFTNSQVVNRLADNLASSWALGILGQAIESSTIRGGLQEFVLGPTLGKGLNLIETGVTDTKRLPSKIIGLITPPPLRSPVEKYLRPESKSSRNPLSGPRLPSVAMPRLGGR